MGIIMTSGYVKYVFTQAVAPSGEGEVEGSLWYNTTLNRLEVYDGSSWVEVSVSVLNSPLLLMPEFYDSIIQGTWLMPNIDALHYRNGNLFCTSHNINDGVRFKKYIAAGTYTIRITHYAGTSQGIIHISVAGSQITTMDLYDGSTIQNKITKATGITVSTSGYQNIDLEIKSKNGSSSDYRFVLISMEFERTA